MMNAKDNQVVMGFREGDIVATPDGGDGQVLGVLHIGCEQYVVRVGDTNYLSSVVKLLRRPVRVGDVLTWTRPETGMVGVARTVSRVDGDRVVSHEGGCMFSWARFREDPGFIVHADGTPIEPPQKPAEAPNLVAALDGRARMLAAQVYANQNQEAVLARQGQQGCSVPADSVSGERFRQERARANRLADELQPLRDERDRLQRRCDALELQMRRAGIVPKDGAK